MALKNEKWVNIVEAATLLNLSVSTIRRRIKEKKIKFKKQGGVYLIDISGTDQETNTEQKEQPKEKKTTEQPTDLLEVLIKQLDEKDKLIKELNERIREAHVLASGRLLGNGKQEQEQEQDQGEIIYATGNVSNESENVTTQPTKDKKHIWNTIITGLVLLATLGLIGLMIYQSGIIRF